MEKLVASMTINKLRILKGPDRLLRISLSFSSIFSVEHSLEAMFETINGLLIKHHGLSIDFKKDDYKHYFEKVDDTSEADYPYGASSELSMILFEWFVRKKHLSELLISFYPSLMEYDRKMWTLKHHSEMNPCSISNPQRFNLGQMRNGTERVKSDLKLKLSKAVI